MWAANKSVITFYRIIVYKVDIVIAIIQSGYLRLRELKELAQIHGAGRGQTEGPDSTSHASSIT